VIDELVELLHRQASAAEVVAARTRALELVVAAGERRFLGIAVDELEVAVERLSGLELARSLSVVSAGLPADLRADDLLEQVRDPEERERLASAIEELREASTRLEDVRERAEAVAKHAAADTRARQQAAQALASA
jgi:hypothetical protein